MKLRVIPNTNKSNGLYPHHMWEIWAGSIFGCFTQKRMDAERVKKEIQQSLKKLDQTLSRYEADEPMTPLRKLYWKAAQK
jgi:hypothetical protein